MKGPMTTAQLARHHETHLGRKRSKETCAKISTAKKGKKRPFTSEAHRKAISEARMGIEPWNKGKKYKLPNATRDWQKHFENQRIERG